MINKIKKAVFTLSIAGLGGLISVFIYTKVIEHPHLEIRNISDKQPVQNVNLPGNVENVLTDFTKAADMTVHGVVHVKTYYSNQSSHYAA